METARSQTPEAPRASGLYGAVWRWHFYAGLFVVPFMLILAVTGGAYLFKHEFERWWYADMLRVTPTVATVPLTEQAAAVEAAFPGAPLQRITLAQAPDLAQEWSIRREDGGLRTVFVDPYTGRITGSLQSERRFMNVMVALHGKLMMGRSGELLIELAACWAFVLIVTGLYLWWPRDRRLLGALVPRLTARGRIFWRDLHAVPAVWNAIFIAFLILSGLPWASVWGEQLARLGTVSHMAASSPNFRGAEVPQSKTAGMVDQDIVEDEHAHHRNDRELPWAVRHTDPALSGVGDVRLELDRVEARIREIGLWHPGLRIAMPQTPSGTFRLGYLPDKVMEQRTVYLDQYSGEVLRDVRWQDYSPIGKATEFGVSVHMGREYGLANQLIGLLSCVLIVLTAITGLVMWWKRRPSGRLGAPLRPRGYRVTMTVLAITLALAVIFPLVGVSLLAVILLDTLVRRLRNAPRPA